MPELSNILFQQMRRIDGSKFMGHLTASAGVNTKERAPYRILHVKLPTFIVVGNTVFTYHGEVVILMEHPNDFAWARSFKAAYARRLVTWKRPIKTVEPITGLESTNPSSMQNLGPIYVNMDTPQDLDLQGVTDLNYRFITGQDVQAGDQVGEWKVEKVAHVLGVQVAYAS